MVLFSYRGITSELDFIKETQRDFQKIIGFLLDRYEIDKLDCYVILINQGSPDYIGNTIRLSGDLLYYQQLDFQFAHELTHAIQNYQKRGLTPKIRLTANGSYEQAPYPNHSFQETEAVANSAWVIERVLRYDNYNARTKENPEYYDYDKAFELVDSDGLKEIWETNNRVRR